MYDILIKNTENLHEYEELIKLFLRPDEFRISSTDEEKADMVFVFEGDKDALRRKIYTKLCGLTSIRPPWGVITGIRPVKMTGELIAAEGMDKARNILRDHYLITDVKADKAVDVYLHQNRVAGEPKNGTCGLYIGIPFCPSRCLYCSFTSNQKDEPEIERYMSALEKEMDFVSQQMRRCGMSAESIYIGGGTPTTLNADVLRKFLSVVKQKFSTVDLREFTMEAGRPDTITEEKLTTALSYGVTRISINPQTMKEKTLEVIGRNHSVEDVVNAFDIARKAGVPAVNADIIAGLPYEDIDDFISSVKAVIELGPQDITVHNLAIKRASKLAGIDKDYHYKKTQLVTEMLDYAEKEVTDHGYMPYYLYRQKQMAGSCENTGYALPGYESVYNIRIMDEHQTIVAMGAGGISKAYYPDENRLERVPNVSNYEIYIDRIDEMIQRKKDKLFGKEE